MGSVTGLTAARMLAIEASSVVSGAINTSGHLILTTHGGAEIDAGGALVAVPSVNTVQFLDAALYTDTTLPVDYPVGESYMWMSNAQTTTSWPTFTGKWGSLRTVKYTNQDTAQAWTRLHSTGTVPEQWMRSGNSGTGWSAWSKIASGNEAVKIVTGISETTDPTGYPTGVSLMNVGSWTLNGGLGTVVTNNVDVNRCEQTFYSNAGGTDISRAWIRTHHSTNGGGGWTGWRRISTTADDYVLPSTTPTSGQWYRVATFTSGSGGIDPSAKASAEFVISTTGTGLHSFIRLRASVALNSNGGNGATLSVEECSGYGASPMFTKARLVALNGANDGNALELYCGATVSGAKLKIEVKHDDWLQTTAAIINRWGSIGFTSASSTPVSPASVLMQRGIGYTGGPIAPIMLNNWTNLGLGVYGNVGYNMTPGGIVQLHGVAKATSGSIDATGNTPMFILPEGCRPGAQKVFPSLNGSNGIARIDVLPDGKVSVIIGDIYTAALDGISFLATQ